MILRRSYGSHRQERRPNDYDDEDDDPDVRFVNEIQRNVGRRSP